MSRTCVTADNRNVKYREKKSNKQKVTFLRFGRYLLGGIRQYLEILLIVLERKVLLSSSR